MRCSSSEADLSAYIDGDLGPVARARLVRHLQSCARCETLLAELRSIDALLLAPRQIELAANFSFAVMADVRALPIPHARRSRPFAVLATYVVFAWSAIGAFSIFGGAAARATFATLVSLLAHVAASARTLAGATGDLFGRHAFDVTAAMGALLGLDLAVAGALVALYAVARGRRAALGSSRSW